MTDNPLCPRLLLLDALPDSAGEFGFQNRRAVPLGTDATGVLALQNTDVLKTKPKDRTCARIGVRFKGLNFAAGRLPSEHKPIVAESSLCSRSRSASSLLCDSDFSSAASSVLASFRIPRIRSR